MNITKEQRDLIEEIEELVHRNFHGATRLEASDYIRTYYELYALIKYCRSVQVC